LVEFIDANVHGRLEIEDLAQIADMPVVAFLNAFQASFGVPPFRYVAFVRVRDVRQRLANEACAAEAIAQRLGYRYEVLQGAFRDMLGIGMEEYQRLRRHS
jgi:transcriptional regulator GlxA family with amidase domain